ncbi:type IV pilin protein [Marinobacter mangrovi]|uniref:type IV pilin protein n=1 Tax=Marinobacter mangrovi TaxID=2803918 RepID=UPI0019311F90|nr:type IV pilin protein [Marinobacter mangrovi]
MNSRRQQAGFTLMSVLITVVIDGILSAIAIPSYQRYVIKSRRIQAESCLVQYAQYMERFRSAQMRYDQDSSGTANTLPDIDCTTESGLDSYYAFDFAKDSLARRTFTLEADPQGAQTQDDCGTLTLTEAGVEGADEDVDQCW